MFIYSVEDGSAADKAGLKMGDVIMKIDGTDVDSYQDLVALKKKYSAGDESTFTIYRDGKQQEKKFLHCMTVRFSCKHNYFSRHNKISTADCAL